MEKNALYLGVNVFSTKVLIGDTMFTSPTGGGTAVLHGHPRKGAGKRLVRFLSQLALHALEVCALRGKASRRRFMP